MKEDGGRGEGVGREITQTSCEAQKLVSLAIHIFITK